MCPSWLTKNTWCHDLSTPAFISMVTKSTLQVFNGFIHISLQHLWHGAGLVTVLYMALETSDNLSPPPPMLGTEYHSLTKLMGHIKIITHPNLNQSPTDGKEAVCHYVSISLGLGDTLSLC